MKWQHYHLLRQHFTPTEVEFLLIMATDPDRTWSRIDLDRKRGQTTSRNNTPFRDFVDRGSAWGIVEITHPGGRGGHAHLRACRVKLTPLGFKALGLKPATASQP